MNNRHGSLLLVGISRHTTPLRVLERAALDRAASRRLLLSLRDTNAVEGAIVLSTCNRTEIYAVASVGRGEATNELREMLAAHTDISGREIAELGFARHERDAIEHFFAVASGLDSVVLGEPEIVAQVRAAIGLAKEAGTLNHILAGLAAGALAAGRRVRARTAVSRGAISVPSVAVELATTLVGELDRRRALVIGAGRVGRSVAHHLASRGAGRIVVANRSASAAVAIAREVGGRVVDLSALSNELAVADLAVSATGSPSNLISRRTLEHAVARRTGRLVVLDLAVPRDVDPAARNLPAVMLRDIDEIHQIATENLHDRQRELPNAWSIVRSEAQRFHAWHTSLDPEPLLAELRRRAEEIRALELGRALAESPVAGESELVWVDTVTRSLVNKLLHEATVRIRGAVRTSSVRTQSMQELLNLWTCQEARESPRYPRLSAVEPKTEGQQADRFSHVPTPRRPRLPAA